MILAIDPGANTGWCIIGPHPSRPDGILACGAARYDARDFWERFRPAPLTAVYVEIPQVYRGGKSEARPNDLITLAFRAGLTVGMVGCNTVVSVAPRAWKGTLDKDVCHRRIQKRLDDAEVRLCRDAAAAYSDSVVHNMWDAVGIALHSKGRFLK